MLSNMKKLRNFELFKIYTFKYIGKVTKLSVENYAFCLTLSNIISFELLIFDGFLNEK